MHWTKHGVLFAALPRRDWAVSHVAVPIVEPWGGKRWRVFFSARDARSRSSVGYVEIDLRTPGRVTHLTPDPVLTPGSPGSFDDAGAMGAWIVTAGDRRYLYYIGWNVGGPVPFRNALGVAVWDDASAVFTRWSPGPILDRSIHDPCFVASPCVLVENGVWRMWYTSGIAWKWVGGVAQPRYHIKYAESCDGIHWQREGLVCIDFRDDTETAISRPCVLKDRTGYKMWYSYRGTSYRIGYAESTDGIMWTRKDEEAGIDVAPIGWDSEMIEYPFVFDHGGQRYLLYNGNGYGKTGIGLAILEAQ